VDIHLNPPFGYGIYAYQRNGLHLMTGNSNNRWQNLQIDHDIRDLGISVSFAADVRNNIQRTPQR
jgi:hypothetical protein